MQSDEKGKSKGPAHLVYLVGVDHLIQHTCSMWADKEEQIERFSAFLARKARDLKISGLAEEFNDELLRINHTQISTVAAVAQSLGLEHLFCEPNTQEKEALGISDNDTPENRDARERFWLERLRPLCGKRVLFVCGDEHLHSFRAKLREAGIPAKIIAEGWGKGLPESLRRDLGIATD